MDKRKQTFVSAIEIDNEMNVVDNDVFIKQVASELKIDVKLVTKVINNWHDFIYDTIRKDINIDEKENIIGNNFKPLVIPSFGRIIKRNFSKMNKNKEDRIKAEKDGELLEE